MNGEDEAKTVVTRAMILSGLVTALARFRVDCHRYPTTEEGLAVLLAPPAVGALPGWSGPYVADGEALRDAWGRELHYVCPGLQNADGYDLASAGPDGKFGTDDDITNWPAELE